MQSWQTHLPNSEDFSLEDFLHISFSHHILILSKIKERDERLFYIRQSVSEQLSHSALKKSIAADEYHHRGNLPNNFTRTMSTGQQAIKAISTFNRALNCLVAVELKTGKFKTSYLGQLQGYLSVLDGFERKSHENPAIGLILCKDINKSFVDYVIQDYAKPMGVATYKTSKDMSEELRKALPDIEDLKRLLDTEDE